MQRVNIPGIGPVDFPDTMSAEQINQAIQNEILPFYSRPRQPVAPVQETTAPAEQPQRGSNLGFAGDLVGSGISGLGGIGTAAGGLYGLATGDYDTGIMRLGRRAQRYGESFMSPELLASREKLERDIQEAGERGPLAEAGAAFRGIATDPRLLTSFVAEQVPQFIGSLGVGRAAGAVGQYAARRGGAEAAEAAGRRAAVGAAIGTGTGLQTGEVADSTYQDVMNLAPEVIERSPNYQLLRQNLTEEEARQSLAVRAAREAAAIAAPISAGTAALFGAERFALGDQIKRRAISRVVLGATGEASQEGIEEGGGRFARNVGASRADIERDLMQGVGGAAAQGAILGAVIGGGTGLVSGRAPDQTLRGEDDDLRRSLDPFLSSIRRTPGVPGQPDVADNVRLVTENLPVTAEQFLNATPRAQEILINRAQRQAEGRLNAENLPVRGPEVERGRIPPSEVQRFPQSASTPSDELVSGQAGARAQGFQFEEGRAEPMEGGITQAEFFRQRAEEMARAQAGTAGVAGRAQVEGAPQLPDNILRRSDKGLLNLLKTASPQDAQLIARELERRRAEKAGAPAAGQPTAAEATAAAAGQTYRPSLGTQTQQTAQAARATRPTSQPISAFFPLVENFIEGHVRNYGSSQPLSVPAFQQYLSERTGDVVSLKRASEIFDTYYNASSKRAVPAGSGWILQRKSVKETAPKGQPSGRGRGRMPPTVTYGEGAQSQRVYRAVAPKGVNTDADGRPLPPAAPPAAPLRAGPSGFTDPRMRELSGRETEGQPAAATEQASVEQDEAAVKRAKEIVNDRLDKLEKRGGKKLREAVARVIRDGKFDAEQVYAAFMAADQIAKILPAGANHEIEFVDRLLIGETKAAKASGSVKGKQAQGERLRPTGDLNSARFQQLVREGATIEQAYATVQREAVEGLIRLSLAPNQLPFLRETAAHEAFHVLQDYYKKYDPQFAALMDKSFRDDMMITDLDPTIRRKLEQARFPGSDKSYWQVLTSGLPRPLTAREAQAYAFGSLVDAANRGVPMTGLKPAFARFTNFLRQFFTRMGNALRGDGFQTAESLLGRVGRGDAQRFSGRAVPTARDVGGSRTELSARETETIKSKPGVNARRLAKMLGPQLYGDMKDMGAVSVKEVLQNSFDAIKASLAKGDISQGRIDVDLDGHKIVMTDNGVGMSPEMLGGKFLQIAGTGKSEDERASGGFGIAKMLFLYGNNSLRVTTMKDGRVAELNTTGPQLFDSLEDSEKSPDIEVRAPNDEDRYRFPEGHGTRIEMVMPEEFDNPATGKTEKVDPVYGRSGIPALRFSPLFEDIEVVVNGLIATDIGSAFKSEDYTQFTNVKFPWGTARIYVSKEPSGQNYGDNLHVLSNGLWQFSQKLTKEPGQIYSETIPYTFYVDVSPSVRPEDPGYPFTFNRQGFTKEADSEYGKVIKYINALYAVQNLADYAKSFGVIQYVDPNTGLPGPAEDLRPDMPTINTAFTGIKAGDNVTVEKGRLLVNGRELPELSPDELRLGMPKAEDLKVDPSKIKTDQVMIHDNVMVGDTPFSDLMRERFGARYDEYNAYIGEAFKLLRNEVSRIMNYPKLMDEAIGVSIDQEYRGVSIRVPFSGSFVNPMVPEANDPYRAGFGMALTMVHELAHHKVRSHNAKFPAEMQRIQYELMADPNFDFSSFQKEMAATVRDQYADVLAEAQRIFKDENITARGNRFEDSPYERRSESGSDRFVGRDRDSRRAGGAGERVLGEPVPSNRLGREGGRIGEAARDSAAGRAVDREYSARQIDSPEFRNWFGDSKAVNKSGKPLVLYHGTAEDFDEFRPSKYGTFGSGIYLTTDPDRASRFATGVRSDAKAVAREQGQVIPVYAKIELPFDDQFLKSNPEWRSYFLSEIEATNKRWPASDLQNVRRQLDGLVRKLNNNTASVSDLFLYDAGEGRKGVWSFGSKFEEVIKSSGFDGVISKNDDGDTEYVVFKPNQVKSAISNRGAFSPDDARIQYSARDIGPETLGNRIRNASPGDVRGKEFEVEYTRVADLINRGLRKVPLAGRAVKETTGEDLIIMLQDRMLPLGRMVDTVRKNGGTVVDASDIYMTEELYHGRVGAAVDDRAERLYKPVFDAMRNLGVSEKDLDDYLMARHAPERNAAMRRINEDPSKGAGITDQQAADIMQRLAPQKTKLDKVAKLVDAIVADTNTTRSGNGLTPDYSKLNSKTQYKHYVPLKGFAEEDIFDDKGVEALRARTGQGFKIRGKEDRSAMGRQSRAGNILANVILQNEESVIRAEKNKVGQALLKLIRDNPQQTARFAKILEKAPVEPRIVNGKVKLMPQGLYRNRDDVMVVKEGGNEVAVQIYDERLAKALTGATGLGAENSSIILNALGKLNYYLARVNTTLNPEFVISNFARDLQTANINIKQFDVKGLGRKIISDLPSALAGARAGIRDGRTDTKWAKAYDDFRKAGGTTEYLGLRDFESKIKQINDEVTGNKGPLVLRPFKTLGKLIDDYNSVAENGIRLATFQTLRDMGVSDAKAAQVAKNLTVNFNKGGQNRVLMNSLYLFYNASIQGSMAMVNAIARSKRVRKYVAGIITAGFMHDVINAMISGMDEDEKKVYDKIPPHVLERNYVLMDPFGLTERGYYAFPMPYGFNAFFNMGRNLSRASRGVGEPMETATSITMGFVEAFNPMGGTQTFFNFVAPTILDPFVDLYSNRNFAGRPISPEQSGFGPPAPDSQRYWSNTFPPYVTVARWLNQITGGTSVIPGKVDISPNTIGYLMNYATGAAGAFAERVAKFGFSTVPDALTGDLEEVEVRDIPFVRKLYGNVTRRNDLESFMENTNKIAQVQRELDEAEKYGQAERMERVMREYPRELAAAPLIQDMVRERRKITREMNEIRRDPNIDDETKRVLLRALGQEADFYVGQANRIYNTQVRN